MDYQFNEKVDKAVQKAVKSTQRFYNELRRAALENGGVQEPPSLEVYTNMIKGMIEASLQLEMDKLRNPSLRENLERTWNQKLLNYSTQRLMRESYQALLRRF